MVQDDHPIPNTQAQAFCFQSFNRLSDRFVGQDKSPPVDGNHESRLSFPENLQGFLRVKVIPAKPFGFICRDRKKRKNEIPFLAFFGKDLGITGVSREEDRFSLFGQEIGIISPDLLIEPAPFGPMGRLEGFDFKVPEPEPFIPAQLDDSRKPQSFHQILTTRGEDQKSVFR